MLSESKTSSLSFFHKEHPAHIKLAELDKLEKSKNEGNTVRQKTWALNFFQTLLKNVKMKLSFL